MLILCVNNHTHKHTDILCYFLLCVCLWWSIFSSFCQYSGSRILMLCTWISSNFASTCLNSVLSCGFCTRFHVVLKWTKSHLDVLSHVLSLLYAGMHQISRYHLIPTCLDAGIYLFKFSSRDILDLL